MKSEEKRSSVKVRPLKRRKEGKEKKEEDLPSVPRMVFKSPELANEQPAALFTARPRASSPKLEKAKRRKNRRASLPGMTDLPSVSPSSGLTEAHKEPQVILSLLIPQEPQKQAKEPKKDNKRQPKDAIVSVKPPQESSPIVPGMVIIPIDSTTEATHTPDSYPKALISGQKPIGFGKKGRKKSKKGRSKSPRKTKPIAKSGKLIAKITPELLTESSVLDKTKEAADDVSSPEYEECKDSLKLARKLCTVFTGQFMTMCVWCAVVGTSTGLQEWYTSFFYFSILTGVALLGLVGFVAWFPQKVADFPRNVGSFVGLTILQAYTIAGFSPAVGWQGVLSFVVIFTCMFCGLTSYSFVTRSDFSRKGSFLNYALGSVIGFGVVLSFRVADAWTAGISFILVVSIGAVIVFDINRLCRDAGYAPRDYLIATLRLYTHLAMGLGCVAERVRRKKREAGRLTV